jgi:hypothetical protein
MSQRWKCPRCGQETTTPVPATEVTCARGHRMVLIEGDPIPKTTTTKGTHP